MVRSVIDKSCFSIALALFSSRLANGSSKISIGVSLKIDLAKVTLLFSPPEYNDYAKLDTYFPK